MHYQTGEKVEIGDCVLIEHGQTSGIVYLIHETIEDAQKWGLDEIGISIEAKPFGLVFWPVFDENDPIIFKKRVKD